MSHFDLGPLPAYNSLTDNHLSGYFSNTRMRRHLRKSGLITRKGEIVSENTYRLNMARKEHKKHVKDMLAQAIVHKTLDLERSRQSDIRQKLEEIAKIELVRRVKDSRQKKRENYILPLVSPRGGSRPSSGSTYSDIRSKVRYKPVRPKTTPSHKKRRPISALSSNYDDDNETVVYLDDEGRPISPSHVDEGELRYTSKDPIDTRHLYSLDTHALRKYALLMAKMEQGKDHLNSPYLIPQVPIPPKSPHHRGTPRSQRLRAAEVARLESPKKPINPDQAYLHPSSSAKQVRGQQQSMCEIFMIYHGSSLSLAREQFDKRQSIVIEQQHCGGNTLTVFKDKMEPDTEFSFISYRHRSYPFALTIYIDGKMDCRISTCCEYRRSKGRRMAGKNGHFSIRSIEGARPCYKCQVEKGIRVRSAAPRRKPKGPPKHQEEVFVVETKEEPVVEEYTPVASERLYEEEEILVPVDDDKKYDESDAIEGDDNYDDDEFEDSEAEEERFSRNLNTDDDDKKGRMTSLGQVKEMQEDEKQETSPRPLTPLPVIEQMKDEIDDKGERRDSVSSSSSSLSVSSKGSGTTNDYSDSKVEEENVKKEEQNVVSMETDVKNTEKDVEIPVGSSEEGAANDGGDDFATKTVETEVEKDEDEEEDNIKEKQESESEDEEEDKKEKDISRASSSSVTSSSSSGSAAIHDEGPNTVNDPTVEEYKVEDKEEKQQDIPVIVPPPALESTEPPKEFSQEDKGQGPSSSSGADSDDESSSSDIDNTSKGQKEKNSKKETTIETTADVHKIYFGKRESFGTFSEAESDPEATHGGNDPDNVANENVITVSRTIDPVPHGVPREGSILPLLEASKTSVEIKGVTLNKTQVYEVAEFLEKTDKLNTVTLVNCGIDDDDIQKLMEALRESPSNPVMVNLSLNPLTSASVNHILRTVKIKISVEAVLLQGSRLGDNGVSALVDGLISQYEERKDNEEENDKGLHELDLSDCKFGDEGALAVARLLMSGMDIDTITLSHNHAVSNEGWKTFGDSLKETSKLETITLDHNFIGDDGIESIALGLLENDSVTALDVNDVGMTDKGARSFMELIKKNTTILEIVMMDNKVSEPIVQNIQSYIAMNKASYSN